jgi:hypothetical protein
MQDATMRHTRKLISVLTTTLVGVVLVAEEPAKPTRRRITVDEIQNSVVIGHLGVPLGEVVTVKVRWEEGFKGDSVFVSEVNGHGLEPAAEFWHDNPSVPTREFINVRKYEFGRDYMLRVYETANFYGIRDEWETETGNPPVAGFNFWFYADLNLLREAPEGNPEPDNGRPAPPTQRRITVKDIQNSIVVGRLGIPLGEVATIVGRWENDDSKKNGHQLLVSEINGRVIDEPLPFSGDPPTLRGFYSDEPHKLEFDQTYRLRVYESAGFTGIRPEWYRESGEPMPASVGFSFQSDITVLRDITSGEPKPRNERSTQNRRPGKPAQKRDGGFELMQVPATSRDNLILIGQIP